MPGTAAALSLRVARTVVLVIAATGLLMVGWWVVQARAEHAPASTVHVCSDRNGNLRLAEECRPQETALVLATEDGLEAAQTRVPHAWSAEPRDETTTFSASAVVDTLQRLEVQVPETGLLLVSGSVAIENTSTQDVDVRLQALSSEQLHRLSPGEVSGAAITGSVEITEEIFEEIQEFFDGEIPVSLRAIVEPSAVDASEHIEFSSGHLNVQFFPSSQATFVTE